MIIAIPSAARRSSTTGVSLNGSMLAIAAFVIVAIGIVWYALTDNRSDTALVKAPAVERSAPDGTTGYGGARPKAPAQSPAAR